MPSRQSSIIKVAIDVTNDIQGYRETKSIKTIKSEYDSTS